jgi:hypothetical protein
MLPSSRRPRSGRLCQQGHDSLSFSSVARAPTFRIEAGPPTSGASLTEARQRTAHLRHPNKAHPARCQRPLSLPKSRSETGAMSGRENCSVAAWDRWTLGPSKRQNIGPGNGAYRSGNLPSHGMSCGVQRGGSAGTRGSVTARASLPADAVPVSGILTATSPRPVATAYHAAGWLDEVQGERQLLASAAIGCAVSSVVDAAHLNLPVMVAQQGRGDAR